MIHVIPEGLELEQRIKWSEAFQSLIDEYVLEHGHEPPVDEIELMERRASDLISAAEG